MVTVVTSLERPPAILITIVSPTLNTVKTRVFEIYVTASNCLSLDIAESNLDESEFLHSVQDYIRYTIIWCFFYNPILCLALLV